VSKQPAGKRSRPQGAKCRPSPAGSDRAPPFAERAKRQARVGALSGAAPEPREEQARCARALTSRGSEAARRARPTRRGRNPSQVSINIFEVRVAGEAGLVGLHEGGGLLEGELAAADRALGRVPDPADEVGALVLDVAEHLAHGVSLDDVLE